MEEGRDGLAGLRDIVVVVVALVVVVLPLHDHFGNSDSMSQVLRIATAMNRFKTAPIERYGSASL